MSWDEVAPLAEVYDRTVAALSRRFSIPAFRFWERILPYGHRLRADLAKIRQMTSELVTRMEERVKGGGGGRGGGVLVRELLKQNLTHEQMIDAALSFANAGGSRGLSSVLVVGGGMLTTQDGARPVRPSPGACTS